MHRALDRQLEHIARRGIVGHDGGDLSVEPLIDDGRSSSRQMHLFIVEAFLSERPWPAVEGEAAIAVQVRALRRPLQDKRVQPPLVERR